jgi:ribosome-associated protein
MESVFIKTDYITLGQFLKFTGSITNGSEAKTAVLVLKISINGVSETRRGRKIYPGDVVKIEKKSYVIVLSNENK